MKYSTWDHPCDGYYKRLYEEEKKKKEVALKVTLSLDVSTDKKRIASCVHSPIYLMI